MKTPKSLSRWPEHQVLSAARQRTSRLSTDNTIRIQRMLESLMAESGWTESDFLGALCRDAVRKAVQA